MILQYGNLDPENLDPVLSLSKHDWNDKNVVKNDKYDKYNKKKETIKLTIKMALKIKKMMFKIFKMMN